MLHEMYAEWCLCQDFDPSHDRCDLKQNLLDADCDTTSIVFPDHADNKTLVRHTLLSVVALRCSQATWVDAATTCCVSMQF